LIPGGIAFSQKDMFKTADWDWSLIVSGQAFTCVQQSDVIVIERFNPGMDRIERFTLQKN
jgi:hypothetical protein